MSRTVRKTLLLDGRAFEAELRLRDDQILGALIEGETRHEIDVVARRVGSHGIVLRHEGRVVRATVLREGDTVWVALDGRTYTFTLEEPGAGATHHAGEEDFAISPMTGTVVKLDVEPGARVEAGAALFVVEAMKMEYVVRAPRDLTIAEVRHAAGDQVDQGRVVVTFEAAS